MSTNAAVRLAVAVVLAALEAGTTQFVSIWFSAAAVAATVVSLVGAPFGLQLLVFAASSAIAVSLTRPLTGERAHVLAIEGAKPVVEKA
ncbi:MAG: hypothetical protein LBC21_02485 [Oscillospiraceae bacterium]|jgi:membrane protein implicated in regulation of membrane protease activity|nr:hypothetical protein [Oscillospiraceae bacterium]